MSKICYILNYKSSSNQLPGYVKDLVDKNIPNLSRWARDNFMDYTSVATIVIDSVTKSLIDMDDDIYTMQLYRDEFVGVDQFIVIHNENLKGERARTRLKIYDLYLNKLWNKSYDLLNDPDFNISIKDCEKMVDSFCDDMRSYSYSKDVYTPRLSHDEVSKRIMKCVDISFSNFMNGKTSIYDEVEEGNSKNFVFNILSELSSCRRNMTGYIDPDLYKLLFATRTKYNEEAERIGHDLRNVILVNYDLNFKVSPHQKETSVLIMNDAIKNFAKKPAIFRLEDLLNLFDSRDYGWCKELLGNVTFPKNFNKKLTTFVNKNLRAINLHDVKNIFLDNIIWTDIPENILHSNFPDGFETTDGSFKLEKLDEMDLIAQALSKTMFTGPYSVSAGFTAIALSDKETFEKLAPLLGSNFYNLMHGYNYKTAVMPTASSYHQLIFDKKEGFYNADNMKLFIESYCSIVEKVNTKKDYEKAVSILMDYKLLEYSSTANIPKNIKKYIMEAKLSRK